MKKKSNNRLKANNSQNAVGPIKAKLVTDDEKQDHLNQQQNGDDKIKKDNDNNEVAINSLTNNIEQEEKGEALLITGLNVTKSNAKEKEEKEDDNQKSIINIVNLSIVEVLTYSEKENYLKEKLNKMSSSDQKMKNTTELIGLTLQKINEEEINKDFIHIHEHKFINNTVDVIIKLNKDKQEIPEYQPYALKKLHYLRKSEMNYKSKLESIEQNQKLLSNESNFTASDNNNNSNNTVEKRIRLTQINKLNEQMKIFSEKLIGVHNQIEELIMNEHKIDKKNIIKEFINNFKKDKDNNGKQVIQIEQSSAIDRENMEKDKTMTLDKRIKELDKKDKDLLEKKEKLLKENNEKEKEATKRRKMEMEKKVDKTRQFIQLKSSRSAKDYLFNKMNEAYLFKEKKLLEKIKLSKRIKCVSRDEIDELSKSLEELNDKLVKEAEEKALLMKEMWRNRSQLIPTYRNPIENIIKNEEKELHEQEELNKLKPILLAKERKLFSDQNIPKPRPNSQLKRQREDRMGKKGRHKIRNRRENLIDLHTHILKPIKNKAVVKSLSAIDLGIKNNNSTLLIKKPARFISFRKGSVHALDKAPDYLSEIRRNKLTPINNNKNWNKIASDPKGTPLENIDLIKAQTVPLEIKAQQKKELLRLRGGYGNNQELGDSLADLLVDSIKAKLAIIKALK